jgi:hypothetical protein
MAVRFWRQLVQGALSTESEKLIPTTAAGRVVFGNIR